MLAFVDVQYHEDFAWAACVVAAAWTDATPMESWRVRVSPIAPYEPGAFYKRELPCLLAVLQRARDLETVVIDGYVTLDRAGTWGLGAHLHEALHRTVPIVGVAKTALGVDVETASRRVRDMHGPSRVPTLLRAVDQLARQP